MSRPVSLREAQHNFASFGTTREREFYKYLPPIKHTLQHVTRDTRSTEFIAHSSSDSSLSAFAQLGALRLDAQRGMISLFGRHEQYILAEATRTLSLRDDTEHNSRDELWVGNCTMSYQRSFCKAVADLPPIPRVPADQVYEISDLAQDGAYKDHPDVTSYPNVRFLACVPITSPKGVVIGAYTILDDKPHGPLRTDHLDFLTDMSTTVMNYLVTSRSISQHLRGERMIVGLGSFLEGKGSLRTSWLHATEELTDASQEHGLEGHANLQQQGKQRSDDTAQAMAQKTCPSHLPFRSNYPLPPNGQTTDRSGQIQMPSPSSKPNRLRTARIHEATNAAKTEKNKPESNKASYTTQVKETFSRAANLVRESLEVEGVIFFDANFSSQEALVNDSKSDHESSLENSSSEGEIKAGNFFTQPKLSQPQAESSGKATLNPCRILGFSTSNASSINGELTGDDNIALSELFLGRLLRRYSRGKIFNFGEDGSISSDDTSDGIFKNFSARRGKKYQRTRRSALRQDAMALLNLAPDSRSIIFSPVWDSHKSRWYAGTLAWTRVPQRVFTFNDQLTFFTAFGNSVMAEIHRLGALLAERAKSDLLAGISHELRSPLHGILGTAELLNETMMDALQRGFVHTIASCTNTLLGSIDQLLEFSSINDLQSTRRATSLPSNPSSLEDGNISQVAKMDAASSVQMDVAGEETIETVFAGYSFFQNSRFPLRGVTETTFDQGRSAALPGGVKVILDIDTASNWRFFIHSGAWHTILANLVGNSLKYTQQGYIYVSLKATPVRLGDNGEAMRSTVTITVKDTGCGMNSDFVRDGFFTAFSQEDEMSSGNGLGASIVHQAVLALDGDIQVLSQKGVGTQVVVSLTLDHDSDPSSEPGVNDNTDSYSVASTNALVRRKTIGILGLGTSDLDTVLSSSLKKLCDEWFQMAVRLFTPSNSQFAHCDFYIAHHEYLDIGNLEIRPIAPDLGSQFSSPIIVICSSPRIAHSLSVAAQQRGDSDVLEFVSQPCGPRKLAKTLEICIKRQQWRFAEIGGRKKIPENSIPPLRPPTLDKFKCQIHYSPYAEFNRHPMTETASHTVLTKGRGFTELSGQQKLFPEVERPPQERNDPQPSPQQGFPTVLLVDDNDINLRLLVAWMKKLRCNYVTAQNGQEALDSFKENVSRIGIVLMDISMPVMDGLESSRQIRAFERTLEKHDRATIIALTGVAQADVQRVAMGSGMDFFITKPARLDTIALIIKNRQGVNLASVQN